MNCILGHTYGVYLVLSLKPCATKGRGEQDHAVRGRRERERKSAEAATTTIGLRRRGEEVNGEAVGVP